MFVLVANLIITLIEDFIATTGWVTVSGDLGTTLTLVVLTCYKVQTQQLFGGPTNKDENSQTFCQCLRCNSIFSFA